MRDLNPGELDVLRALDNPYRYELDAHEVAELARQAPYAVVAMLRELKRHELVRWRFNRRGDKVWTITEAGSDALRRAAARNQLRLA
jgi:DNA-binding MarR family transcriptional regulator